MTKNQALRLALEYVEELDGCYVEGVRQINDVLITAIKAALSGEAQTRSVVKDEPVDDWSEWRSMVVVNLMRHGNIDKDFGRRLAHYFQDKSPQHTWVGLDDDEITQEVGDSQGLRDIIRNIEHKLKERNT